MTEGQILRAQNLFEFISKNIMGIKVFFTQSIKVSANDFLMIIHYQ